MLTQVCTSRIDGSDFNRDICFQQLKEEDFEKDFICTLLANADKVSFEPKIHDHQTCYMLCGPKNEHVLGRNKRTEH